MFSLSHSVLRGTVNLEMWDKRTHGLRSKQADLTLHYLLRGVGESENFE